MSLGGPDREALIALLEFHVAAGVDLALDEEPHDRFREGARVEPETAGPPLRRGDGAEAPRPSGSRPAAPFLPSVAPAASMDAVAADARAAAAEARDLAELERLVAAFDGCSLKLSAKNLAFADGTPGAKVMILGEAPGAEEDRAGRPFVGRAGQLLDRMLNSIGLDRTGVYIANFVPWRPPGNRTPTPQEVAICLPFTLRQIELAAPAILLTLGAPATQALLGVKEGIFRTRGRWVAHQVGRLSLSVLPMLHPAYLLRQPLHKRLAWRDLLLVKRALAARPGTDAPGEGL